MKRIIVPFALLISAFSFQSCVIDDNDTVQQTINEVFELKTDFAASNNYEMLFNIKPHINSADHILVYRLWAHINQNQDIWRLLPNTVYFTNGDVIKYNFDHSMSDMRLFLEPNFNLNTLSANDQNAYLNNQIFRVVVVPGGFNAKGVDFSDYEQTIEYLGLSNAKITKL